MDRYPGALRDHPVDMNDRAAEKTARLIPWQYAGIKNPDALKALEYFESTAWLFRYKGRLVMTDESLYLTDAGDGRTTPIGGPRYTANTRKEIETWLADVWQDIDEWEDDPRDEGEEVEE